MASVPLKSALKKTSKYATSVEEPSSSSSTPLETHLEVNEAYDDCLTKKEKIQIMIHEKREADARAKQIVHNLIETGVERNYLLENAAFISTSHWEDIVEERKLSKICGWVLCDNELKSIPKQQFKIRNNKVLDISERKSFCSAHCYAVSDHFKQQLLISPLWMRDEESLPEFQILEELEKELHGMEVSMSKLKLGDEEKEDKSESSDSDDNE